MATSTDIVIACTHQETIRPGYGEVKLPDGRVVLCCEDCMKRSRAAYQVEYKAWMDAEKARGRAYWAGRGIAVGGTVRFYAPSWIGIGATVAYGTAKVGKGGAWVCSKAQRGKLAPEHWHKIETDRLF